MCSNRVLNNVGMARVLSASCVGWCFLYHPDPGSDMYRSMTSRMDWGPVPGVPRATYFFENWLQ